MKKECLICGKEFERTHGAKRCPECRKAGKRICGHCGKVFVTMSKTRCVCKECDAVRAEKARRVTDECHTAHQKATPTKRICEICEKEFEAVGMVKYCPNCRTLETKRLEERARKKGGNQIPKDPQRLVNAVQAARALGVSYGQYSAMKRGLLKV